MTSVRLYLFWVIGSFLNGKVEIVPFLHRDGTKYTVFSSSASAKSTFYEVKGIKDSVPEQFRPTRTSKIIFCGKNPKSGGHVWPQTKPQL